MHNNDFLLLKSLLGYSTINPAISKAPPLKLSNCLPELAGLPFYDSTVTSATKRQMVNSITNEVYIEPAQQDCIKWITAVICGKEIQRFHLGKVHDTVWSEGASACILCTQTCGRHWCTSKTVHAMSVWMMILYCPFVPEQVHWNFSLSYPIVPSRVWGLLHRVSQCGPGHGGNGLNIINLQSCRTVMSPQI